MWYCWPDEDVHCRRLSQFAVRVVWKSFEEVEASPSLFYVLDTIMERDVGCRNARVVKLDGEGSMHLHLRHRLFQAADVG